MSASDRSREADRRNGDAGIVARGLTRHFGEVRAVDGVDLEVAAGEVYGFLGPNGAGKTTITRMLCTLLRPTSGGATVAGYDIVREAGQVRLAIGVTLQEGALDDKLTGRELLRLQGRFYGLSRAEVERRIEQAGNRGEVQGWRPTLDKPNIPRPPDGMPQDIPEHMRLMSDILVLGFQTDTTRVCTLKLNNDHSYLLFRHLGVTVGHHELSHQDNDAWLRVNQFFVEQLAYIARKLDAVQEASGPPWTTPC